VRKGEKAASTKREPPKKREEGAKGGKRCGNKRGAKKASRKKTHISLRKGRVDPKEKDEGKGGEVFYNWEDRRKGGTSKGETKPS